MVVHFVAFILAAVGSHALSGSIVGAVEEAVSLPGGPGELRPFDMVREQFAGGGVHHVELLPVASAAGNAVGRILAVVAEIHALEGHGAVFAEGVGVQEHARLPVRRILLIEHALVLQAVVLIKIPFAVGAAHGSAHLLIVTDLLEALQQLGAERNMSKVVRSRTVLGFDPGRSLVGTVIFQPAVRVGHLGAEIVVGSGVLAGLGRLRGAGENGQSTHCCRKQSFHIIFL